jgi:hypothetical protein
MSRQTSRLRQPATRHRTALPLLTILGLIAWLAPPLEADVIDDFSGPRKFRLFATRGNPACEVKGEMRMHLATAGDYAAFWHLRTYELPEQQPVEFRLDVVSLNAADTYACLTVGFISPPELPRTSGIGYELAWLQWRVLVAKEYGADSYTFLDTGHPLSTEPVTMVLTLTRQGKSMEIGVKVVQRDAPEQGVASASVRGWENAARGPDFENLPTRLGHTPAFRAAGPAVAVSARLQGRSRSRLDVGCGAAWVTARKT